MCDILLQKYLKAERVSFLRRGLKALKRRQMDYREKALLATRAAQATPGSAFIRHCKSRVALQLLLLPSIQSATPLAAGKQDSA
jgi:hypothetical protein